MLSWIMNCVAKNLIGGVVYVTNTQVDWEDLKERFDKIDGSRSYNIHQEIATCSQSVSVHYCKLKELWDELGSMIPTSSCNYEGSKEFVLYLQWQKLYQFLMCLNESYA